MTHKTQHTLPCMLRHFMPSFKSLVKVCPPPLFMTQEHCIYLMTDIALQHSIINAQKETVLKSRQRIYVDNPKPTEPQAIDQTHTVYAHADTVVQHRDIFIIINTLLLFLSFCYGFFLAHMSLD